MKLSTFDLLVRRLTPVYGVHAPALARQIPQTHRNFGSTEIKHVRVSR